MKDSVNSVFGKRVLPVVVVLLVAGCGGRTSARRGWNVVDRSTFCAGWPGNDGVLDALNAVSRMP